MTESIIGLICPAALLVGYLLAFISMTHPAGRFNNRWNQDDTNEDP